MRLPAVRPTSTKEVDLCFDGRDVNSFFAVLYCEFVVLSNYCQSLTNTSVLQFANKLLAWRPTGLAQLRAWTLSLVSKAQEASSLKVGYPINGFNDRYSFV
jgi:hypothetical protein